MPRWLQIAAGLVGGLLLALAWSAWDTAPPRKPDGPTVAVSEVDGTLREVWLQYAAQAEETVGVAQADFVRALAKSTTVWWTAGGPAEMAKLQAYLQRNGLATGHCVQVPGPITPWTRDRALAAERGGHLELLMPPAPDDLWPERLGDWHAVHWLAQHHDAAKVVELPLDFDGGDVLLTGTATLFDANLLAKNRGRGYATMAQLGHALQGWTGRPAVGLGSEDGDVPRYHMAMYLAPVGPRKALVGSPALGRAIVGPQWRPGDLSADDDSPLLADDTTAVQARFDRVAADLGRAGWAVTRIPVVAFDDRTYVTYTNAVTASGDRDCTVWLPVYAQAEDGPDSPRRKLDAAGIAAWRAAGFAVHPVRVAGVWRHHGTIGCLVNILRRGAGPLP